MLELELWLTSFSYSFPPWKIYTNGGNGRKKKEKEKEITKKHGNYEIRVDRGSSLRASARYKTLLTFPVVQEMRVLYYRTLLMDQHSAIDPWVDERPVYDSMRHGIVNPTVWSIFLFSFQTVGLYMSFPPHTVIDSVWWRTCRNR